MAVEVNTNKTITHFVRKYIQIGKVKHSLAAVANGGQILHPFPMSNFYSSKQYLLTSLGYFINNDQLQEQEMVGLGHYGAGS